ncbi:N-acetylmuramoyl-L-alanine amidase [Paenibacillus sp. SI8]|uniref:N-acetylmuramoyl-L-alanine amidase n=1 Tax=unclassified Paenibacillus TaxID=185978 RepID=UPI00346699E8
MVLMRRSGLVIAILVVFFAGICSSAAFANAQHAQTICLDPGHQRYGNNGLEPLGPNSKEMKEKVSSGTRGVKTRKPEYVLSLEASVRIKEKLESFGYQVVMTRDNHDVNLSNKERATICNQANADLAVRIHADGDASASTEGISLLYPAASVQSQSVFAKSKEAAQVILQEALSATGAASRGTVQRADLSGFNWSEVPTILVEMGFMTNPQEDEKLSDAAYLDALAQGIANGINATEAVQAEGKETEGETNLYVAETTRLYELSNGKMIRTTLSLSPQIVRASSAWGNWRKIHTWVGDRWVNGGSTPIEVELQEKQLELKSNTSMYRSPLDPTPIGGLTPQNVQALGKWKEWYFIDTWMGKLWISLDIPSR